MKSNTNLVISHHSSSIPKLIDLKLRSPLYGQGFYDQSPPLVEDSVWLSRELGRVHMFFELKSFE